MVSIFVSHSAVRTGADHKLEAFSPQLNTCGLFVLRLCVAALAQDSFCGIREALYGVFDGDRNVEVPYLLQCTMGDVLAEELHRAQRQEDYMTNTFLTMQR